MPAEPEPEAEPEAETEPAEEFEGQADLDRATELKLALGDARDLQRINRVVGLLESAQRKGLDEDNADFAEQMLIATLLQRATMISTIVFDRPAPADQRCSKWSAFR